MATNKTPQEAAEYILEIMAHTFNVKAGHILMLGSFIQPFNEGPWTASDFNAGAKYAEEQGWIVAAENALRLTDKGFAQA
jgi:hypothetical protein